MARVKSQPLKGSKGVKSLKGVKSSLIKKVAPASHIQHTIKKKRRFRAGTVAKRRSIQLCRRTKPLIRKARLCRVIHQVYVSHLKSWRMRAEAVDVIREYVDAKLHQALSIALAQRIRCGKKTLQVPMILDGLMQAVGDMQNNPILGTISSMPEQMKVLSDALETDPVWSKMYRPSIAPMNKKKN